MTCPSCLIEIDDTNSVLCTATYGTRQCNVRICEGCGGKNKLCPPHQQLACDWCGSTDIKTERCKITCRTCKQISASCADL